MDLYILDQEFHQLGVLDIYKSLIWTDRYSECGDFEICITPTTENMELMQRYRYIWREDSEHSMVIEGLQFSTDVESGHEIIVNGRSLESILDRRIVWAQTRFVGKLQSQIKKLLDENVINPTDPARKIPNFIFVENDDPVLDAITIDKQYTGDNLYEIVKELCGPNGVGFKITLTEGDKLAFQLYVGADRSYAQFDNPYIVFSPENENLINSNYVISDANQKTLALVAGEDVGGNRRTLVVGDQTIKGINRKELYVDARDIQSEDENGTSISTTEYNKRLQARGEEKLDENKMIDTFDGEVSPVFGYFYDQDYFLGDICQIENEFGIQKRVRVIEFIRSTSDGENNAYPTFEVVDEDSKKESDI